MKAEAIIKKGTKDDPIWMLYYMRSDDKKIALIEEPDNLPIFQPYSDLINKEDLDELGGELVEVEYNIVGK